MPRHRKNKRSKRRNDPENYRQTQMTYVSNRSINMMPSRFRTRLTFQKFTTIVNNGFTYGNTRFVPTTCYDVDPAGGSTAMPGFSELGALYRFYRAVSFRATATFSNLDATAVNCYICPSNSDPGNNSTTTQGLLSNRRSKAVMIGPSTGLSTSREIGVTVAIDEYGGIRWTGQLDNYCASTTASAPTNNIFVAVGIETVPNMTLGVAIAFKVTIEIEFFELTSPQT